MSVRAWGAAAALLLCLGACGDSDDGPSAAPTTVGTQEAPQGLDGTTFVSTDVTGRELADGTELRLAFEDGSLAVQAGCNTHSAPYSVEGSTLRWTGPPASTMMACPGSLTEQDAWVTDLFTGGVAMTVDPDGATLTDGDVTIQLVQDDSEG
jgi:heat shock protein HslJ